MQAETLAAWVRDARARTLALVADLRDDQLMGPCIPIINPFLWEIGHVAWFQEKWILRVARGEGSLRSDSDALYDSSAIAHDDRWHLPLPSRAETLDYMRGVRDRVLSLLERPNLTEREVYFIIHTTFHEDMHDEAFTYTRQTLGLPSPNLAAKTAAETTNAGTLSGDAHIPGGAFRLGAEPSDPHFVFDNEKWASTAEVKPFSIAKSQVTCGEFLEFVIAGGYENPGFWSEDGRRWLASSPVKHPRYWKNDGDWLERRFDRWQKISDHPHLAIIHVNYFEAEAYCAWANRRLPTELEWEVAASGEPDSTGTKLSSKKRRFPWGDEPPTADRANLDCAAMGTIDAGALPAGDSAFGVRQMIGNVWEWTSTDFYPYPGFTPDPYKEYSEPWFGDHKVLRGGAWTTRSRLIRNTWRNFYKPDRGDVLAGFRTCAR